MADRAALPQWAGAEVLPGWITVAQAAALLGCGVRFVRWAAEHGRLEALPVSTRFWLISAASVAAYRPANGVGCPVKKSQRDAKRCPNGTK